MTIRVLVSGARGRMGREAVAAVCEDPDLKLVGTTTRGDDLAAAIAQHNAQVVVDLTCPDAVFHNTQTILTSGAHPVIGTSGLQEDAIRKLQAQATALRRGGIIVPNFSLGAAWMMHLATQAARCFPDVEIIEAHHAQKVDSPSGTALQTAARLASARHSTPSPTSPRHETVHDIPVHSIRLPGVVAQQEVLFGAPGETLSIQHRCIDRQAFMPGLVLACKRVIHLHDLLYGLELLLNLDH